MSFVRRASITGAVMIGVALVTTITLALFDLYLMGHGHPSIMREVITQPTWGVHLSIADLILLASCITAALLSWRRIRME